jgi:hypothetical protein
MPNAKEQLLIDLGPFMGIDNWTAGYYIDARRATDQLNYLPTSHIGSLFSVLGRTTLTTNPPGTQNNPILGLTRFDITGATSQYIAASDQALGTVGALWRAVNGATTWTQLTLPAAMTASEPTYFAQFSSYLYVCNGIDANLKIDSSFNVTRVQGSPSSTVPTAADSGTGGNLNGTYLYRTTWSNTIQETGAGPISASVAVVNHSINVSNLPTTPADSQFTTLNLYRLGGTSAIWQLAASWALASIPATYTDNTADNQLGQQLIITRDVPPVFWTIASHKDRLFGFGSPTDPTGLWYSNFNEPWGYDLVNQYIPIGRNSVNDYAQNLASVGSLLILLKKQTVWALYGDDPTSFIYRKLFDVGCIAPRSMAVGMGVIFWVARDGVWMFDGSKPTRISTGIESTILNLASADLGRASGAYFQGLYILSLPAQGVAYCYSLINQEWYKIGWAGEVTFYDPSSNEVTASRAGVANIDSWFSASTDLGNNISASFIGKIDDSKKPEAQKKYRWIVLVTPIQSGQTAAVTLVINPGPTQISTTQSIDLGQNAIRKLLSIPVPSNGYQAQIQLTTTSNIQVEIQKLQIWGWEERSFTP